MYVLLYAVERIHTISSSMYLFLSFMKSPR